MRRLKVDVATFTLIIGAVNGGVYYLAPLIPIAGLQGFTVVFLEMLTVWLTTEEDKQPSDGTPELISGSHGTGNQ